MRLEQLEQATGGEGDDAEHQVAEDLEVAADRVCAPGLCPYYGV